MEKTNPSAVAKTKSKNDSKAWSVIKTICKYIYKFRGVIISIPVVVIAIILGFKNAGRLPDSVCPLAGSLRCWYPWELPDWQF